MKALYKLRIYNCYTNETIAIQERDHSIGNAPLGLMREILGITMEDYDNGIRYEEHNMMEPEYTTYDPFATKPWWQD